VYRQVGLGRGNTTVYVVVTALDEFQIADVLKRRMGMGEKDANLTALAIIEKRRQFVQKGVKLITEKASNPTSENEPESSTETGETGKNSDQQPSLEPSSDPTLSNPPHGGSTLPLAPSLLAKAAEKQEPKHTKLYKHLEDGRFEGPYGPYSNAVKAGGIFTQGEALPPDAVIVAATRPRDPLFDAIATHVLGAKDDAAIKAVGWRVGQILHGDKRTGRCEGLLAYECERQGKTEVDRQSLADDVPLFWNDFKQSHPDLELKDCAKFIEHWVKWRGKTASAAPIQVSFIEHDDWVAPSEVK
jgi:hypothetical protein